jgi:hypothetical protein
VPKFGTNTFERQSQIQLQTTNYICDYKLWYCLNDNSDLILGTKICA